MSPAPDETSGLDEDLFDEQPPPADSRRARREAARLQPTRRGRSVLAVLLALALVLGLGVVAFTSLRGIVPSFGREEAADYEGSGNGEETEVTIEPGSSGAQIGTALEEAGVVKSSGAFVKAANASPDQAAKIQPGVYVLTKEIPAQQAFDHIANPSNRVARGVTIAEGLWSSEIFTRLSKATGVPVSRYERAAASGDLKLPAEAKGEVEGWLFPSTYEFTDKDSAVNQLNAMIGMTVDELEKAGVPRNRWQRTLTVASIVEGESGAADRGKVARVIENRLKDTTGPTVGMLNMDSTVHFIFQKRGRAGTTDAMRGSDNPYNTYRHKGLPPGPINNPGAAAIEAAGSPDPGPWLFFVTVNPDTGETKFATTQQAHDNNAKEFQQWCAEHQDRC